MSSRVPTRFVWLAVSLLAAGAYFVSMMLGTGGRPSLPLDDAFIFFQYARQFASGHPFHYSGADPASGGVTSVLTLVIDAVAWLIGFRGDGMIFFAFLFGTAGLYVTLTAAEKLGRALNLRRPWWPPLFVLLCGPLLWGLYAGMDLPVFVGPLLATIAAWETERGKGPSRRDTILWGSVTAASRPEGLLFAVLLFLFLAFEKRTDDEARGRFSPGMLLPVAAGLVPPLILLVFTGKPSPSSMAVKGVVGLPGVDWGTWIGGALEYFVSIVHQIFLGFFTDASRLQANNATGIPFYLPPLALLLFLVGIIPVAARDVEKRRTGPGVLTLAVLLTGLTAASLVVPKTWHWHRYLIPYYVLVLPFAAAGFERVLSLADAAKSGASRDAVDRVGLLVYLAFALPGAFYFLIAFAENSADIRFQQRSLAEWSRTNVPAGALIGVNDAGALAYYGNHPIMDLEGLVTSSLTEPHRQGTSSLWEAMERLPESQRPAYLIVYPTWYDAAFMRSHQLLYQKRILRQTIAGGNPMNVYKADWSLAHSGDLPSSPEIKGLLADKRLVDAVDVADLVDEKAHDYRFRSTDGTYQGLLDAQPADEGGPTLIDGGRVISRSETFRLTRVTPGKDLTVVLRSRSGFRVRVLVDGQEAGEWLEPGRGGPNWTEATYTIPASLVRQPNPEIGIYTAEFHVTAYSVFHYWFYQ